VRKYKVVVIHKGFHFVEYNTFRDVNELAAALDKLPAPATVVILVKGDNHG